MGAAQINRAKAATYKAMYLAVVIAMYGSGLLFVISAYLPAWLTPDPTLQKMIFDLLPLIGFGQIAMSVGLVSWNILSAQGLIRLSTIIEFVVSWLLVMPLSAVLVYVFNFNLLGMVGPLVLGYTIGGVAVSSCQYFSQLAGSWLRSHSSSVYPKIIAAFRTSFGNSSQS